MPLANDFISFRNVDKLNLTIEVVKLLLDFTCTYGRTADKAVAIDDLPSCDIEIDLAATTFSITFAKTSYLQDQLFLRA